MNANNYTAVSPDDAVEMRLCEARNEYSAANYEGVIALVTAAMDSDLSLHGPWWLHLAPT